MVEKCLVMQVLPVSKNKSETHNYSFVKIMNSKQIATKHNVRERTAVTSRFPGRISMQLRSVRDEVRCARSRIVTMPRGAATPRGATSSWIVTTLRGAATPEPPSFRSRSPQD